MNSEQEQAHVAAGRLKERDRVYRKLRSKAAIALEALVECNKEIEKYIKEHRPDDVLLKLMMHISVAYYPLRDADNDLKERGETLKPLMLRKREPKPRFSKGRPTRL